MTYAVYQATPSRALRVAWIMAELGLDYEVRDYETALERGEMAKLHPLSKMPVLVDDERPLFESAAICTWLADNHPEQGMIPAVGAWERALHDQWVSYALTEVEAYLWHSYRNMVRLPEEERVPEILPQNAAQVANAMAGLDSVLADQPYLLGAEFQVTDIIVGFTLNWATRMKMAEGLDNLAAYRERLMAREHCPLVA
jgi:glutathione S-transferase